MESNKVASPQINKTEAFEAMTALLAIVVTEECRPAATHDDCVNLRKLQAQVNQAVYDLCEQCQPVEADPAGPAVCDLGNYAPKAVE